MTFKVVELLLSDGTSPYADWFNGLDVQAATKVTVAKLRMEQGNLGNVKWFQGIGEYRIDWGPGYRVYLGADGDRLIVLLGGGTKRGQQADIETALELWREYKLAKKAAERQGKR